MSDARARQDALTQQVSQEAATEKAAAPREAAALRRLEIEEGDHADRRKLNAERLLGMRQARELRLLTFRWIMLPLLALSSFALLALGVAVARYGFVDIVPGTADGGTTASPWPKVVFISGAFLTFIFVFGALVKGVFAAAPGEEEPPRQNMVSDFAGKIARNAGE